MSEIRESTVFQRGRYVTYWSAVHDGVLLIRTTDKRIAEKTLENHKKSVDK